MVKLGKLQGSGRAIRDDAPQDLAVPTWEPVCKAVQEQGLGEVLDLIEYGCFEHRQMHDRVIAATDGLLTHLASIGEEEVYKAFYSTFFNRAKENIEAAPTAEEFLKTLSEGHRGHFSNFTISEEPDRYVVVIDPCGSAGRLRRSRNVGVTQRAYPWSWGKTGIPYYCTHCCIYHEQIPIELRGYPVQIHELTSSPEDPCIHYIYKKPELIPEEYFTRIGKTKTIKDAGEG